MASFAVSGARLGVVRPGGSARSGGERRSGVDLPSVLFMRKDAFSRTAGSRFPPSPAILSRSIVGSPRALFSLCTRLAYELFQERVPCILSGSGSHTRTVLSCAGGPTKALVPRAGSDDLLSSAEHVVDTPEQSEELQIPEAELVVEEKAYSSAAQTTSAAPEASSEVEAGEKKPEPSEVIEGIDETGIDGAGMTAKAPLVEEKPRVIPPPGDGQRICEVDPMLEGFWCHLDYRGSSENQSRPGKRRPDQTQHGGGGGGGGWRCGVAVAHSARMAVAHSARKRRGGAQRKEEERRRAKSKRDGSGRAEVGGDWGLSGSSWTAWIKRH